MKKKSSGKKKEYKKPVGVKISAKNIAGHTDCHSGGAPPAGSCWRGYDN